MTEAELQAALNAIEEELSAVYRKRRPILEALAEIRGPYEVPPASRRTPTQQLVSMCPRCGGKLER